MKNVASKSMRAGSKGYATWTGPEEWHYTILKSHQADNGKPYARWFMAVSSPLTYGQAELGDTYVSDLLPSLRWAAKHHTLTHDAGTFADRQAFMAWAEGRK